MEFIKEYIKNKRKKAEEKELEYRDKLREDANYAQKEIVELKEVEANKKVIQEMEKLRLQNKKQPAIIKGVTSFFNGMGKAVNEISDAAKKIDKQIGGDKSDMFKPSDPFKPYMFDKPKRKRK